MGADNVAIAKKLEASGLFGWVDTCLSEHGEEINRNHPCVVGYAWPSEELTIKILNEMMLFAAWIPQETLLTAIDEYREELESVINKLRG